MNRLIPLGLALLVMAGPSTQASKKSSKASNGTVVTGPLSIAASTKKKILEVRIGGTTVRRFHVAVGSKGHATPNGHFGIRHIVWNPAWVPPDAPWAKGKEATPPGHPKNPMKVVKIFFQEPDYYIHGTNDEDSIGYAASHGCIRMTQEDAFTLGKFLMDHDGAKRSDDWYDKVLNGGQAADVILPQTVPIVIGP